MLVEELDPGGLRDLFSIVAIGEGAQGRLGERSQSAGVELDEGQCFSECQGLVQAHTRTLSILANFRENVGEVFQLGIAQPPGDDHFL
ncbi:hypothetical protein D9M71_690490 [compost metagenome]